MNKDKLINTFNQIHESVLWYRVKYCELIFNSILYIYNNSVIFDRRCIIVVIFADKNPSDVQMLSPVA